MPVMNSVPGPAMGPATIGVFDFLGASIRPEAELWAGAVRANGGSVVNEDVALVSAFIAAEDAAGAWELTDDYWVFFAPNSVQARVSLKQRRLATVGGSPTFTANAGYTFNGSTYVNTGFIPSSHAVRLVAANARLASYDRTNVGASSSVVSGGAIDLNLCTRSATNLMRGAMCSSTFNVTGSEATDRRGLNVLSRTGTTTGLAYRRGAVSGSGGTVSSTTALPGVALYVGGANSAGSLVSGFAGSIGMFAAGASLSAAQELAQYNNVQSWATIRGANV